ncbi:MAG: type II secretion system protein GspG [Planctomycetes bacterium]|nr:type II secretion system protein GspG [Planctomycetota bacterium]MCB9887119.1 type II secretion system protein GspG [Planctomycetota bacterium]
MKHAVRMGLILGALAPLVAQEPAKFEPSEFVRFVKEGDGGHLDTAVTTYKKGDVEVILYGAVHIADAAVYEALNDRFTTCDALLYELVGPANYRPSRDVAERGTSPISLLQQALKNSMELSFQLDAIDYSPANFVHADMTPEEFEESMNERGESILSIMIDMMLAGAQRQRELAEEGGEPAPEIDLVKAFRSGEGRHTLRMVFAEQMQQIEVMAVGGKDGSTLLEGRNEKCLKVLREELEKGHKRIGIYYGAAHLPHMERRLVQDMGFVRTGQEWLVAWDCKKRPDPKYNRALVKQRRQCRTELDALALVARDYRRKVRPDEVPDVARLASTPREADAMWYAGPRQDPWGNDYVLRKRSVGIRWEVLSAGQDGELGTDDDLVAQEPRGGGLFGR